MSSDEHRAFAPGEGTRAKQNIEGEEESVLLGSGSGTGPPFPLNGQTNRPWREQILTRTAELDTLSDYLCAIRVDEVPGAQKLRASVNYHLAAANAAANGNSHRRKIGWNGAVVERAMSNVDAAFVSILRLAPESYLRGQMPAIEAFVNEHLQAGHPQRVRIEQLARESKRGDIDAYGKEAIIGAVQAAALEAREEFARLRSFRNVLLFTAAVLAAIAVITVVWGWLRPADLALCFNPQDSGGGGGMIVCPTTSSTLVAGDDPDLVLQNTVARVDVLLVSFVGLVAAAVTGSTSLRLVHGTATPFGLPVALAVLKLPTGALTAVLGLLLMRGGFVPGLSALDFPAQILAWAILFGGSQQLLTGFIDRQAQQVMNGIAAQGAHNTPV